MLQREGALTNCTAVPMEALMDSTASEDHSFVADSARLSFNHESKPPVSRLPPEITSEIFLHFLPPYPEMPPLFGPLSPLLLCRICRHWREIAISTPHLWRAICLILFPSAGEQATWLLDLLKLWLARSGRYPLSLTIRLQGYGNVPDTSLFLDTVAAHRDRWEYLHLATRSESLSFLEGDMPLLRNLTFGAMGNGGDLAVELAVLANHAPQLRNLTIGLFQGYFMQLPLAQLTTLDMAAITLFQFADVLRDATSLTHCRLTPYDDWDDTPAPEVPEHLHLRHLVFRAEDTGATRVLLDNLTLPALRTLEVYEFGVTLVALSAFMLRSKCSLDELKITRAYLLEATYRETLASIPIGKIIVLSADINA
ncbi:hypothetical protein C8R46DRAFT_1341878 [Mycena filopes]|nr:hypothetical protein C8R46DRAFT_1341878 [Mycena filopes]